MSTRDQNSVSAQTASQSISANESPSSSSSVVCSRCNGTGHESSLTGTNLRTIRKLAGLTLADLSKRTGMSVTYFSSVENGARITPRIEAIYRTLVPIAEEAARRHASEDKDIREVI